MVWQAPDPVQPRRQAAEQARESQSRHPSDRLPEAAGAEAGAAQEEPKAHAAEDELAGLARVAAAKPTDTAAPDRHSQRDGGAVTAGASVQGAAPAGAAAGAEQGAGRVQAARKRKRRKKKPGVSKKRHRRRQTAQGHGATEQPLQPAPTLFGADPLLRVVGT